MTENAEKSPDEMKTYTEATSHFYKEGLKIFSEQLPKYCKDAGIQHSNGVQFAAIEGTVASIAHVLAAMTVDALTNDRVDMEPEKILEGGVGTISMFQQALLDGYLTVLKSANVQIQDAEKIIEDFQNNLIKAVENAKTEH